MYQRAQNLCNTEDSIYTDFLEEGRRNCSDKKCADDDYLFLCWEWIKWYSLEGEFVSDFLKEIEDYDYIKYGEEIDDITTYFGTPDGLLDIHHEIDFSEKEG